MGSPPGGGKMMQITRKREGKRNITQVMEGTWGGRRCGTQNFGTLSIFTV